MDGHKQPSNNMRVVVTGASGYVGRSLTTCLKRRGQEFIAVSRRHTSGLFTVVDYKDCPPGDVLVHLAQEPVRERVNNAGKAYAKEALNLLESLLQRPWLQVVYASSGTVYGDQNDKPCRSTANTEDTDYYNSIKLACEQMVLDNNGVVARLSNLYGPGMSPSNVVSDILAQIPGEGPVRVRDESPVRDFLHISDATNALAEMSDPEASGIYNVGSGEGITIGCLAEIALQISGQGHRAVVSNTVSGSYSYNVLNIEETTARFEWMPEIVLNNGLQGLISNAEFLQ